MSRNIAVPWPALSFDLLQSNVEDGCLYIVAGTQASGENLDEFFVLRVSNWSPEEGNNEPRINYNTVHHTNCVNRVKAQRAEDVGKSSQPYYVASWSAQGSVVLWDVRRAITVPEDGEALSSPPQPVHRVSAHGNVSGFALDWSHSLGQSSSPWLLSGDVRANIFSTIATPADFRTTRVSSDSHAKSIEDLQWSPVESTIFASCSADASIRIWDMRVAVKKDILVIDNAHSDDVNVLSWNRISAQYLVSGGDDCKVLIWDMRSIKSWVTYSVTARIFNLAMHLTT